MEGGSELGPREACVRYWLPVVACAGLIVVGTSLPRVPGVGVPNSDKMAHLLAYGVLGLLLMRAFRAARRMPPVRSASATVLVGGLYGVMDELHQTLVPGRHCSALDMAADAGGLVLAAVIVVLWWKRKRRRSGITVAQGETDNGGTGAR
ncbi:MAG: VanZ family protein [Armatimonadota bacterium]